RLALFFAAPCATVLYTLSLHDALPISLTLRGNLDRVGWGAQRPGGETMVSKRQHGPVGAFGAFGVWLGEGTWVPGTAAVAERLRSEEHTSELQSRENLVCRLLLEKKKE